jgi:hypothetical protein
MKRQSVSEASHSSDGSAVKLDGLVIGCLAGFDEAGRPLVDFEGNPSGEPVAARTVAKLEAGDLGAEVALMFEGGDCSRPVALGTIRSAEAVGRSDAAKLEGLPLEIQVDGERVEISARREISIRAGDASITLTADGKVVIRGRDLLSRSSGANRIRGGSVQLN